MSSWNAALLILLFDEDIDEVKSNVSESIISYTASLRVRLNNF
jgi:hypothetical protein